MSDFEIQILDSNIISILTHGFSILLLSIGFGWVIRNYVIINQHGHFSWLSFLPSIRDAGTSGARGFLTDQLLLTLFQPGKGKLCPPILAPPNCFTFLQHWYQHCTSWKSSYPLAKAILNVLRNLSYFQGLDFKVKVIHSKYYKHLKKAAQHSHLGR